MKTAGSVWMGVRALQALALALVVTLACAVCMPTQALAYFNKPAVSVSFGAGSLNMTTGSSNSVALNVNPLSEQQMPGCGMSICPQECGNLTTPDGVVGGCLSADGWCQCAGTSYYTAYTQLSVSSSNPGVARATVSGSTLSITAYAAGSTTITVYATLSKHLDGAASMTVTVSDPVAATPQTPSNSGGSTSGATASSGSATAQSGNGSGSAGKVSVTAAGTSATAAAAAAAEASGSDSEVVELEAEDGTKVIVLQATDAATAGEKLKEIAGTEGTCTFWSGGTLDSPSISWTFKGTDLDPDADLSFDPTVTVSKKGSGQISELMADVKNAIVLEFAHSGALPAKAEMYVRASGVYEDGQKVSLYLYNEDTGTFELVQEDIKVVDGYLVFSMDHCSVWALSDEDLSALQPVAAQEGDATSANSDADVDATTVDVHATDGTPFLIGGAVVVLIAIAAGVVLVVRKRKASADQAEEAAQQGEDANAASVAADVAADADAPEDTTTSAEAQTDQPQDETTGTGDDEEEPHK